MTMILGSQMRLRATSNAIEKKGRAVLDVPAANAWERQLYVTDAALSHSKWTYVQYIVRQENTFRDLFKIRILANMTKKFKFRALNNQEILLRRLLQVCSEPGK